MISIKQIGYALKVAANLHFKKAADECFVSPSTLSNAITEMEKQLGFQVFERDNRKVIVTSLGLDFIKKAQLIKLQLEDIRKISELQSEPLSHRLSIGIIPTISPFFIPMVLPKLAIEYPKLKLEIEEAQTEVLINRVKNGDLDMAILALPYDLKGMIAFKFWEEDFFWVSKTNDKRSKAGKIKAEEIKTSELILLEDGNCLKDHVLSACKISDNSQHSFKASTLTTVIQLVKGGMGTTVIPKMAINQLLNSDPELTSSHLDEKGPHREIAIVIRPNYAGTQDVEVLVRLFSTQLMTL